MVARLLLGCCAAVCVGAGSGLRPSGSSGAAPAVKDKLLQAIAWWEERVVLGERQATGSGLGASGVQKRQSRGAGRETKDMHASGTVAAVTELCQLYGAAGRWEDTIECWNGCVRDYPDRLDTFPTHWLLAEAHRRTFTTSFSRGILPQAGLLLQLGMTQQFNLRQLLRRRMPLCCWWPSPAYSWRWANLLAPPSSSRRPPATPAPLALPCLGLARVLRRRRLSGVCRAKVAGACIAR